MLRITMAVFGRISLIRSAASVPLRFGMAISNTTTSGLVASACATACRPSAASPTTANSGWLSSKSRNPRRITLWSSANRIRICFTVADTPLLGAVLAERQGYLEDSAHARFGVNGANASQAGDPFFNAQQAQTLVLFGVEAVTVVLDGKLELIGFLRHPDTDGGGIRVPGAVV